MRYRSFLFQAERYGNAGPDGNGDADPADLARQLGNYGAPTGMTYEDGDLDEDGDVDLADLAALLSVYGTVCE